MSDLVGRLENRDGRGYVHVSWALMDEPVARHLWYLITGTRSSWTVAPDAGEDVWYSAAHRYWSNAKGIVYAEADASIAENRPIPRPKARAGTELRYDGGRWQKYTKSRGWVPA